ncbi:MAG: ABC transporter ATP-binding protein [Gammaproteobacteria bacterium]
MIEVTELSYEYPGLRALDGVSFHIAQGSITALVGPNGAGKTTLLRCLAGLDRPLAGSIVVNGVDVVEEPRESHRHIGYLADFFGLYDELTVRQCLSYVAAANGIRGRQAAERTTAIAADLGLESRLDDRAGELSRGLRQRLAIAQAVIHAPGVILLDEPASGLDPEARYRLGELFLQLRQRGMTLLVSSHILAELEAYSTDMLVLRDGRVVEQRAIGAPAAGGTPVEVRAEGQAEALAAALAARAEVTGVVRDGEDVRCEISGDAAARAAVLGALVEAGLRVSHFAPATEDLQQSYLRSIGAEPRA